MDAYEATRIVFSRIQSLDPENAAKIMGLLLIQDHGEKEMIRLAFGPETLVHSVVLKARKELGLSTTPSTPTAAASPFLLARQNSASRLLAAASPGAVSPSSWAPPHHPFSRSNSNGFADVDFQNGDVDLQNLYGGGGGEQQQMVEDYQQQLQDQLSFLNESSNGGGGGGEGGMGFGYGMMGGCYGGGGGFGWKPCLYFARGYCKNGSSCRFLHGLPDDAAAAAVEQQCQEALLLRSKSQRLMASAPPFPHSPTGTPSSTNKCLNFLLQHDSQRTAVAAAAAAALMLGGEEGHKFMGRARMERGDFCGMVNPGSRQIYLTFPADSTFREEDVSNYFSIYGPVQDVRIPYQQKRMFGFVTFVYPETVKLILAKGNPHFVCDARVLVKPYKEKGKIPDKKQQQAERGDFSGCTTPTAGLDSPRDPYDLQQLANARMLYGNNNQDILLKRRIEEQQAAAELQQAIDLQGRRFMGLQLLDLKTRSLSSSTPSLLSPNLPPIPTPPTINTASLSDGKSSNGSPDQSPLPQDKSSSQSPGSDKQQNLHGFPRQTAVNAADKDDGEPFPNEDRHFQESNQCSIAEHNLPDSPFASPTKSSLVADSFSLASEENAHFMASSLLPATSTLENMASFKSCFFQMPRISSGHGAVGL